MSSNSSLMLHCGALSASLEEVISVETPEPTNTWEPIPHSQIIEIVKEQAENTGFKIRRELYGLTKSGDRMFGLLDFDGGAIVPGYGYSVGFRNSHDKTMAAGIVAGSRVFVCDNLCLSGDYSYRRKHTKNNDFLNACKDAFLDIPGKLENLVKNMERLKLEGISDDEAKLFIFNSFIMEAISSNKIKDVWEEYKQPSFEEFSDPTKFNLLMAYTEVAKRASTINTLERMYNRLSPMFELNAQN